jgi:hypothetical protein
VRIAFVTTCRGRSQHLKLTLPASLAANAHYRNAVFIVLDYGSQDDLLEWLRIAHAKDIARGRVVVYSMASGGPFRMAHAKNFAHRLGIREGGEILVNLDADNYAGLGFAQSIDAVFRRNPNVFMWARMIQRCNAEVDDGLCVNVAIGDGLCVLPRNHPGEHSRVQSYPPAEQPRHRGISGRIVVSRDAFLKVGGYDEAKYDKWGPDDKDFSTRLRKLKIEPYEIGSLFLDAIHHGPKLRFREYPEAQPDECIYEMPIQCNPYSAVVNAGRFGCGIVTRNFCPEPIELKPLPTRIFGIGMHKTGTTSLQKALQILGFSCAHWPSPRWARNVWYEVQKHGTSLTLERTYAACDLPIAVLYQQLDRAYPGSKFILTVRSEVDWLLSVRDHWGPKRNPWRNTWDNDCFTHQMHQILYGRKGFHLDTFLRRYRKHNQDVTAYFHNRPNDLFVMNMDSPDWAGLCTFLDVPVPAEQYPRLNAREDS